jgi:hypothetical protein
MCCFMHFLLIGFLLALQTASVIDVYKNSETVLSIRIGNVIYTAEFSATDLKPGSFSVGERVRAGVKNGKMIVKRKDGKRVMAPVIQTQRILLEPCD